MAFHLGCMRGLLAAGLLEHVTVITSVSGGSVIAALYCARPGSFNDFEGAVRAALRAGFVSRSLRNAVVTLEGVHAVAAFASLACDRAAALLVGLALTPWPKVRRNIPWLRSPGVRRWASRTTILRRTFDQLLNGAMLGDLRVDRPALVIVACELRAKAAFYFTRDSIHCWRYGKAAADGVALAQAVSASAAYPLLLPALDERMTFVKNGVTSDVAVTLTDGGVYDNLGLAPLWPDRDPTISMQVAGFDHIVACRAGEALKVDDPATFTLARMTHAFESVHARAQNFAMSRLYELRAAGRIGPFILPYLGQDDGKLAKPPHHLISRETSAGYPTDFSAMPDEWIEKLVGRGETLVEALLAEHWPHLTRTAPATIARLDTRPTLPSTMPGCRTEPSASDAIGKA